MIPTISYAITACNEYEELERLLIQLETYVSSDDEIIVQLDSNATSEVRDVLKKFQNIVTIEFPLNKDFASFKNNIKKFAKKDYIIYIDADEYPNNDLISYLPTILEMNPEVDLYYVPRWNTVEGLTEEHVQKWGWRISKIEDESLIKEKFIDDLSKEYMLLKNGGFIINEEIVS